MKRISTVFVLLSFFTASEAMSDSASTPFHIHSLGTNRVFICFNPVPIDQRNNIDKNPACVGPLRGNTSQIDQTSLQVAQTYLLFQRLREIEATLKKLRDVYTADSNDNNPIAMAIERLSNKLEERTEARLSDIVEIVNQGIDDLPAEIMSDPAIYSNLRDRIIRDLLQDYDINPRE